MSFPLCVPPGSQTEECTGCLNGCTVCFTLSRLRMHRQGTVQSTGVGSPPPTDQTVNSSVADASILRMPIDWVTQRWFWHKHLRFMYSQATVKDRAVLRQDHSLKRGKVEVVFWNKPHRHPYGFFFFTALPGEYETWSVNYYHRHPYGKTVWWQATVRLQVLGQRSSNRNCTRHRQEHCSSYPLVDKGNSAQSTR